MNRQETPIVIRPSTSADIDQLVSLSKMKRLAYEKAQPQFWRYAGPNAEKSQAAWFKTLLSQQDYMILSAIDSNNEIIGFIIGKVIPAPDVYNPGGLTLMIDDFCVKEENLWPSVGKQLIETIKQQALKKGVAQILVVCGAHDTLKKQFLMSQDLRIASEWFVGNMTINKS